MHETTNIGIGCIPQVDPQDSHLANVLFFLKSLQIDEDFEIVGNGWNSGLPPSLESS